MSIEHDLYNPTYPRFVYFSLLNTTFFHFELCLAHRIAYRHAYYVQLGQNIYYGTRGEASSPQALISGGAGIHRKGPVYIVETFLNLKLHRWKVDPLTYLSSLSWQNARDIFLLQVSKGLDNIAFLSYSSIHNSHRSVIHRLLD
jgi:hypothetical protein